MNDDLIRLIETLAASAGIKVDARDIEALVRRSLEDWMKLAQAVQPADEP